MGLLRQMIHSEKESGKHFINGMGDKVPEICLTVIHALSTYNANNMQKANMQLQCIIVTGTVCTDNA